MLKKQPNKVRIYKKKLLLGGIGGLFLGISGNLISAWIQQDIINNSFTPVRMGLIILCALLGIVIVIIAEGNNDSEFVNEGSNPSKGKNLYSRIRLRWSKFRIRGDVHMEDISAIGSEIDIDAK